MLANCSFSEGWKECMPTVALVKVGRSAFRSFEPQRGDIFIELKDDDL